MGWISMSMLLQTWALQINNSKAYHLSPRVSHRQESTMTTIAKWLILAKSNQRSALPEHVSPAETGNATVDADTMTTAIPHLPVAAAVLDSRCQVPSPTSSLLTPLPEDSNIKTEAHISELNDDASSSSRLTISFTDGLHGSHFHSQVENNNNISEKQEEIKAAIPVEDSDVSTEDELHDALDVFLQGLPLSCEHLKDALTSSGIRSDKDLNILCKDLQGEWDQLKEHICSHGGTLFHWMVVQKGLKDRSSRLNSGSERTIIFSQNHITM
ncbi:hypothetical protein C8Q75DRAFT_476640 [Abortiporus biennis]|nr:hypothetical protein C8Q75DRAFT_476640 [Abortiporus biennis]